MRRKDKQSKQIYVEAPAEIRTMMLMLGGCRNALLEAGFTRREAMHLISMLMQMFPLMGGGIDEV